MSKHKLLPPDNTLDGEMAFGGSDATLCGSDIGRGWRQRVDACEYDPSLYIDIESFGNFILKMAKEFDIDIGTELLMKIAAGANFTIGGDLSESIGGDLSESIGGVESVRIGGTSDITNGGLRTITAPDVIVNTRSLEALFARVDELSEHHNKGPF